VELNDKNANVLLKNTNIVGAKTALSVFQSVADTAIVDGFSLYHSLLMPSLFQQGATGKLVGNSNCVADNLAKRVLFHHVCFL